MYLGNSNSKSFFRYISEKKILSAGAQLGNKCSTVCDESRIDY